MDKPKELTGEVKKFEDEIIEEVRGGCAPVLTDYQTELKSQTGGEGQYTLEFSHRDLLEREYTYTGPVRVLDSEDYNALVNHADTALYHAKAQGKNK